MTLSSPYNESGKTRTAKRIHLSGLFLEVSTLTPSYFSLVMATGIVSIAALLLGFPVTARILFYVNIVAFVILCILYVTRLIYYSENFKADFINPAKSPGFLTFVAAVAILGNQFIQIARSYEISFYLFVLAIISWLFLIYAFFTLITVKKNKPNLEKAISGTWLLTIVSTQSIAVLSLLLIKSFPAFSTELIFFSLVMFLLGCMFYFIIITLIVYRLSFFELTTDGFAPPYWINMGAAAITTLAGSVLILNIEKLNAFVSLVPFIKGFTLMFWAFASWWIPLMIVLGIWRHIIKHLPLKYLPQYWGMIFPLGMYSVCTYFLAQVIGITFLMHISTVFLYVAICGWGIVFMGLIYSIILQVRIKSKLKKLFYEKH